MGINSRFLNLDTDVTLSSNSDEIIPSQKAIKTYVDTKDSNAVHKTGNETIAGTKTFSNNIIGNLTGTASKATADASGNTITSTYIPKNFGGSVASTDEAITSIQYGTSARPKGFFANLNLLHAVENKFYKADKGLKTGTAATITSTDSTIGANMFDGSYSGYWTSINPSTSFTSENPFVFEVKCPTHYEVTDVCNLYLVGHRLTYGMNATAFKIEVAYAYSSANGYSWGTVYDYSGSAVGILNRHYGLYYAAYGGTNSYHNVYGVRLTISGSTSTAFALAEIMLLSSRGTERVTNSLNALDTGAGGKVTGDITIPTDYGAFKGLHKGNVESDQVKITGNHTFTNQVANSNNDLVVKVNNENFVVCEYNSTNKTIRPSNTSKGILDLGSSTNKYNNVYANTFNGNLTGTASKATADASGNTITTTYATKTEVNEKVEYAMVIKEW